MESPRYRKCVREALKIWDIKWRSNGTPARILQQPQVCRVRPGQPAAEFQNGRVYRYHNVPPEEYEELIKAPSLGRYFIANIRDGYGYDRAA